MANRHFGEIGDVWKHLLLAGILEPVVPAFYLESHAGSAFYPLTPSTPERDYGIGRFRERAPLTPGLARSAYARIQQDPRWRDTYPGSPSLAMSLLGAETAFAFCDLDAASLESIGRAASVFDENVVSERLHLLERDGLATVEEFLGGMSDAEVSTGVVFLDPYDPYERGAAGRDAFRTFAAAAAAGALAVLWYGFVDLDGRARGRAAVDRALRKERGGAASGFEMELVGIDDPDFTANPGVRGCSMVVAGLDEITWLGTLADGLVEAYRDAWLPTGEPGAIRHEMTPFGSAS